MPTFNKQMKAMAALFPTLAKPLRWSRDSIVRSQISKILASREQSQTTRAESDFGQLQKEFNGVPEYGFDPHSVWKRGMERASLLSEMLHEPNHSCRILEVGCGDAMTGYMLSIHGHLVTVSDMDDWRDPRAASLEFCQQNLERPLPFAPNTFDLIYSYNSFEHFQDPAKCFGELSRLVKPSGVIHLSFGPLYASPWGLHAWSSLKMPYPQFLFSEKFISEKIKETGICDLGKQSDSLQPLNRWTVGEFCNLWSDSTWHTIKSDFWAPKSFLYLIKRYPECFFGRGLTYEDVTVQAISVTLRRRIPET